MNIYIEMSAFSFISFLLIDQAACAVKNCAATQDK